MAMKLEQKKAVAEELAERFRASETIYLTDFTGLDVQAMTELRARLREEGVEYRVAKNTLARRALDGLDLPELAEHLKGPTGLVFGDEDPVVPAKIVRDFAREHDDRPTVKVGVVSRRMISAEEVARLAALPPRDELLASIMGSLTAPVSGIVSVLNGLLRDIAHMAGEVAKKREEGAEA
ncbi:MAG TPA: 50S ribosomal protein L10 [Gemmatimonadota bacterium]|nr:50S ribosomal protein L10 [Gemmatimonadota bacterium]